MLRAPGPATSASGSSSSLWPTPTATDDRNTGGYGGREFLRRRAERWPTPDATVINDRDQPATFLARREAMMERGINGNGIGTPLAMAVKLWDGPLWMSPRCSRGEYTRDNGVKGQERPTLEGQAGLWASPLAQDGSRGGNFTRGNPTLTRQSATWKTPNATEGKGSNRPGQRRGQLAEQAEQLCPTGGPSSPPAPGATSGPSSWQPSLSLLPRCLRERYGNSRYKRLVENLLAHERALRAVPSADRARLNPLFAEWLMGWPIGWTDSEQPAEGLSLYRRRLRSSVRGLVWCMTEYDVKENMLEWARQAVERKEIGDRLAAKIAILTRKEVEEVRQKNLLLEIENERWASLRAELLRCGFLQDEDHVPAAWWAQRRAQELMTGIHPDLLRRVKDAREELEKLERSLEQTAAAGLKE